MDERPVWFEIWALRAKGWVRLGLGVLSLALVTLGGYELLARSATQLPMTSTILPATEPLLRNMTQFDAILTIVVGLVAFAVTSRL